MDIPFKYLRAKIVDFLCRVTAPDLIFYRADQHPFSEVGPGEQCAMCAQVITGYAIRSGADTVRVEFESFSVLGKDHGTWVLEVKKISEPK